LMKKKKTELGKQVRIRLIELDMTQVQLAQLLGVSKQSLNNVLQGEASLKIEEKLKDWLGWYPDKYKTKGGIKND